MVPSSRPMYGIYLFRCMVRIYANIRHKTLLIHGSNYFKMTMLLNNDSTVGNLLFVQYYQINQIR